MSAVSHPRAFRTKIERHLAGIAQRGQGGGYVIYAIKDPRGDDPRDSTDGPVFYVGQTANLGRRANQHLRKGGARTTGGTDIAARVHAILAAGKLPIFDILERVPNRVGALTAETRWAQHFCGEGRKLANRWAEHKKGAEAKPIPTKRLWALRIDEAVCDGIGLEIACRSCDLQAPLPLDKLAAKNRWSTTLSNIRSIIACPACGHRPCLRLRRATA
jgi:predicted GIY-YIG superfamily endonuclease